MEPQAQNLLDSLVDGYRPFVETRLAERGVESLDGIGVALDRGIEWLTHELTALLSKPFHLQTRSPLEVFQEAMRFPTAALEQAGFEPVVRDEVAAAALPGDVFDLAPASSQDLGETAWHAHIAWGASKAASMTRPVVAMLSNDLMDGSRVEPVVAEAGFRLVVWRSAQAASEAGQRRPVVVFVDLDHRDADAVIESAAEAGSRVVAFGPHVDDVALTRAMTIGANEAVARSRFFRSIASWLPRVV